MPEIFKKSDHCDGKKFYNLDARQRQKKSFVEVLKWKARQTSKPWPNNKIDDLQTPQISTPVEDDDLRITYVNHATALIEWRAISILTDPVLSEKLGPFNFLNLRRFRDPGIGFNTMPKIDFVFISHNHYDHLDSPTLEQLESRDRPRYIVPLGVSALLPSQAHSRITELDWWQSFRTADEQLTITLTPAQHWSRRTLFDMNRTLWAGALFKCRSQSVFFAGDSGYSSHFQRIREELGRPDVALLPIGAYEPRWFMKSAHMNPEDAVQAHLDLKAKNSLGIHFGTFRLTDEGIDDPIHDLKAALTKNGIQKNLFIAPKNGETFQFKNRKDPSVS
jgi:L-ascorbate metabolism protein UlaG (beta-lactamase superfamily)